MNSNIAQILTIGHSTHTEDYFLSLLQNANITALVDVRTVPFSRYSVQFNRDNLKEKLKHFGISYVFLGNELGGRPKDHNCYHNGIADYEKMANEELFQQGLERVLEGSQKYHVAMMCSEQEPLDCHRCLLVSRALVEKGVAVGHILANGSVMTHDEIENKLLTLTGRETDDFFAPRTERLSLAYKNRAIKVAFSENKQKINNH